jgi:hypothetical protein
MMKASLRHGGGGTLRNLYQTVIGKEIDPQVDAEIDFDLDQFRNSVEVCIPIAKRGPPPLFPFQLTQLFSSLEEQAARTGQKIRPLVEAQALLGGINPDSHWQRYQRWKKQEKRRQRGKK